MITLYRAMCKEELDDMFKNNKLSFKKRFKWFGTLEFVIFRVKDGKFNNSRLVEDRYKYLVKFMFSESSLQHFSKCGFKEFMLDVRKTPLISLLSFELIGDSNV
jgi:hypothetical protein